MISKKHLQLFGILIGSIFTSTVLFNNCSGQVWTVLETTDLQSLDCGSSCVSTEHPDQHKVDNVAGEVLDVRQTLESYLSLLGLKAADLGTDLTSLIVEKNRRAALLPQENNSSLVSPVSVLSQVSMAGEVCRVWVNKKAANSAITSGVNLREVVANTPKDNWVKMFSRLAEQSWGRPLDAGETQDVDQFITALIAEAAKSKLVGTISSDLNVESANLATMICTGVLASPENTML